MDKQTMAVLDELKSAQKDRTEAWQALDKLREEATDDDGNIRDNALEDLKSRREQYEEKANRVLQLEEKLNIVGGSSVDRPANPFDGSKSERRETEDGSIHARSFREGLGAFIESDQFKALKAGNSSSTGPVELKTLLSEDEANAYVGSGGPYLTTEYIRGIQPLRFQRLTVADLLATGTTNAVSITYFQEKTWTNAAAAVAEAGLKPEDTFEGQQVTEPVRKIAHIATVTDEMLEDGPAMASYLDSRLRLGIGIKEEALLYGGNGTPPNLKGIINRTGVQTQAVASDSGADAIYKAITKVRNSAFVEPDGVVIHPTDWEALRLSKDANKQYFGGGPFTGAYGSNSGLVTDSGQLGGNSPLWGQLRVVVTTAATQGTALVGAFATEAQIFRRTGLTVESTNSHDTNFAYNKVTFRAEERLALAVYQPTAFVKVTGSSFTTPA